MGIKKRFSKKDKKIVYEASSKYDHEITKKEFHSKKEAEEFIKNQEQIIYEKEHAWYLSK